MEQDQQTRGRPTRRQVQWFVGIVVALVVATIVLGYVLEWEWTGLVKDKAYTKRTLWDWLQLLIIPAALAGVGLWFNRQQRAQELQTADRRTQEDALQAYLGQMSEMLIPNNDQPSLSDEHPPNSLKTVARARTLTVLPRLDGERRARVVQFLYEAGLLIAKEPSGVDLGGADLSEASLEQANLSNADLHETNLSEANLSRSDLAEANLSNANLSNADLSWANLGNADLSHSALAGANLLFANLSGANLSPTALFGSNLTNSDLTEANLSGAYLGNADLSGANLLRANLSGAQLSLMTGAGPSWADLSGANLSGANLSNAELWTAEQLTAAWSLNGATMPSGQKYEDWLKSQGRGEAGENNRP